MEGRLGRLIEKIKRPVPEETPGVVFLNRDQMRALAEERAQIDFGMTSEKFALAFKEGILPDVPEVHHVAILHGIRPEPAPSLK